MERKYVMIGAVAAVAVLLAAGAFFFSGNNEKESIEKTGVVLENGARLGIAVPKYTADNLGIATIADLDAHSDKFGGRVIGIDAGAGIMLMAENALAEYGLGGMTLIQSSESSMLASLKTAYESGEDIAVTLWDPHWVSGTYEMVYLQDPKLVFGEAESIESWARPGLKAQDEDLARIMSNYSYGMEEFGALLAHINASGKDASEAAKDWLSLNQALADKWLDGVEKRDGRGNIKIGLVNWACAIGTSNVLKHLLESVGYSVTLTTTDAGIMYAGLSDGEIDLITTAWVPLTHAQYMEKYA